MRWKCVGALLAFGLSSAPSRLAAERPVSDPLTPPTPLSHRLPPDREKRERFDGLPENLAPDRPIPLENALSLPATVETPCGEPRGASPDRENARSEMNPRRQANLVRSGQIDPANRSQRIQSGTEICPPGCSCCSGRIRRPGDAPRGSPWASLHWGMRT